MSKNYSLQPAYYIQSGKQFHAVDKRTFYAACYGNYLAELIAIDFFHMYLMGGEL